MNRVFKLQKDKYPLFGAETSLKGALLHGYDPSIHIHQTDKVRQYLGNGFAVHFQEDRSRRWPGVEAVALGSVFKRFGLSG